MGLMSGKTKSRSGTACPITADGLVVRIGGGPQAVARLALVYLLASSCAYAAGSGCAFGFPVAQRLHVLDQGTGDSVDGPGICACSSQGRQLNHRVKGEEAEVFSRKFPANRDGMVNCR